MEVKKVKEELEGLEKIKEGKEREKWRWRSLRRGRKRRWRV